MRKVSMGVSPMSLKKNKCSRHLRPMERSAGNRSNSLANLSQHKGGGGGDIRPEDRGSITHVTGMEDPEEKRKNRLIQYQFTDKLLIVGYSLVSVSF